jgi:glutathione S-transferase/GST-like protein
MIDLYHWEPNAESLALLICLKEKGLEFRSHYVDMLQLEHHSADYLDLSPKAQVPLLLAEGEAMSDTGFALQYLAERYPESRLAPTDPSRWYDLQAWAAWLGPGAGLAPDVQLLGWNHVMVDAIAAEDLAAFRSKVAELPREKVDRLANAEERVQGIITRIESTLAEHAWIVGEEYSIVDMMAYAQMHGLPDMLPEIVTTPNVIDWLEKISSRPAVTDAISVRRSTIVPVLYFAPGC